MKSRSFYGVVLAIVMAALLASACLSKKSPTATPPPTNTPARPQILPTDTPGPTPTPLPPDQVVPAGMVSPVVIQHSPQIGEELPLDGAVELVFDRAMDKAAVEKAFVVSPAVDGKFEWADARTLRFVPANLKRGENYHVYLGQEASDAEGAIMAGAYRFRFQTVGYLEVAQVIPAPDSVDVQSYSTIIVMFNRPVVPLTSLKQMEALPNPLTFDPPISGTGEWLNTSMYLFTPDQPLAGGTQYNAHVLAGLTDTIGGVLELDYAWSFTTEPPKVIWTTPRTDGNRTVPPNTVIRIQFNQPIDPVSAQAAFSMIGGTWGTAVAGAFEVLTDTLVFTPTEMLEFDKMYTVHVDAGVLSALSAARADIVSTGMRDPYEWTFNTSPLPRIVETRPAHLERNAPPYTAFEIVFNTTIDPATVMVNLQMTPAISPTQVYTYFSDWNYTFVLGFGASPSTDYEVNIGPDIADPFGNTTGQRKTVNFRTAPLDPSAQMHVPDNISTLNTNDSARLFVSHVNIDKIDFKLYNLTRDEFFALQHDWYNFNPTSQVRQWREVVESPLNERIYTRVELVQGGGALEPGFYLIDLDTPDIKTREWRQRHLLVVSAINLTLKSSEQELLVWATDLETGRPVANLALALFDWYDGTQLGAAASTDTDGLARLPIVDTDRYYNIAVLSESPFVAASAYWNQGISIWEFGFGEGDGYQPYRVFVDTDRPLYRAGQTVYLKGVVRGEDDVEYWLPDLGRVQVTIRDAAYNTVLDQSLPLDKFGAFSGELALPEGASLGAYSIYVQAGDSSWAHGFQVAAYRPPEFEVLVEPAKSEILLGQSNQAEVQVRYFFGGPVQDVPVSWNVLGETYTFDPSQFGRYTFSDTDDPWVCRWCWWRPSTPPQVLLSGSGRTDAEGNLLIELPAEWLDGEGKPITYSLKLQVEATVSGNDGQVISGRNEIVAHRSDIYIGLAAQQYVGQAEKEMSVDLLTVDWSANRQPNKALKLSVYRREWKNVFVENEAGGGRWTWTTEDVFITESDITTGANGEAVFSFVPPVGGSYHVIAESPGTQYAARSSLFVWVSGKDYISWRRTNDDRIDLIADKGVYRPGETAEILIPSPFQGEHWAWITIERGGVLQQEVLKLTNNSTVYRLPITDRHVPNIYISAVIVKGKDANNQVANFKVGYTALTVEPETQTLHVELVPAVEQALPGETVTFDVRATDSTGKPVAASFALDLVDKAVLSLMPRQSNAILNAFYGRRALQVNTASGLSISLSRLLIEQEELNRDYGVEEQSRMRNDG
ncbi:MAG: Ig-like domain-containing protein, partial [Anaerolineae bacterium]|nr:Ig-like domain-containing protein [Anaerolineae bacterium]